MRGYAMGEGLQWFFSTIADLPGRKSARGGVCYITPEPCSFSCKKHIYTSSCLMVFVSLILSYASSSI